MVGIVSLHLPLDASTRAIVSTVEFRAMKPTAVPINTCRGPVVDETALIHSLETGEIFATGLDVMETAPIAADNPRVTTPNVVLTPHLASRAGESTVSVTRNAVDNAERIARGHCRSGWLIPRSATRPFPSICLVVALGSGSVSARAGEDGWSHYGASLAGDRYAAPSAITPESVEHLSRAWTYRTGDATSGRGLDGNPSRIRATPILVQGKLIVSTGFNRVYALDPGIGEEIGEFDPRVDFSRPYSEMFVSRGVAAHGPASVAGACRTRVFLGTLDARLIAIDADTGTPCDDFGEGGEVDLSVGIRRYYKWDYSVTSPPTVVGQVVVVGSAVGDNGGQSFSPAPSAATTCSTDRSSGRGIFSRAETTTRPPLAGRTPSAISREGRTSGP